MDDEQAQLYRIVVKNTQGGCNAENRKQLDDRYFGFFGSKKVLHSFVPYFHPCAGWAAGNIAKHCTNR